MLNALIYMQFYPIVCRNNSVGPYISDILDYYILYSLDWSSAPGTRYLAKNVLYGY